MKKSNIFVLLLITLTLCLPSDNYMFIVSDLRQSSIMGTSKFSIRESVNYSANITLSLTHISGPGNYYIKHSRLNDRTPDSPLSPYCPPYQEGMLLLNDIQGYDLGELRKGFSDQYNNTYDSFQATLNPSEHLSLTQHYHVKLNQIVFSNITDSDIEPYDTNDIFHELYCKNSEQYYEKDNPQLISVSNSIVDPSDNPVEKAEKICNWVSNYLEYNDTLGAQELGALWAYQNKKGDCSEFASLAITLMRIQGIPARKVTGMLVSLNPELKPEVGDSWEFGSSSSEAGNILGHAWMEYYVPGVGWIACDPTWNKEVNYFNRIDYLRFNFNVGEWFSDPLTQPVSEFANPFIAFYAGAVYEWEYHLDVSVIETTFEPDTPQGNWDIDLSNYLTEILLATIVGGAIIIALVAIVVVTKKRKY